jgi:RNA binding exosome subunit
MRSPIQSVEVTYLLHATEDPTKVADAVSGLLGVRTEPEEEVLEGHFGNRIEKIRLHLTGEEAGAAFASLVSKMPPGIKRELVGDLQKFLDEHSALFLRFDKQLLISGGFALASGDPVRIKVKPRIFMMKGGAASFYEHLIGG